jgi:hypothetical protein
MEYYSFGDWEKDHTADTVLKDIFCEQGNEISGIKSFPPYTYAIINFFSLKCILKSDTAPSISSPVDTPKPFDGTLDTSRHSHNEKLKTFRRHTSSLLSILSTQLEVLQNPVSSNSIPSTLVEEEGLNNVSVVLPLNFRGGREVASN